MVDLNPAKFIHAKGIEGNGCEDQETQEGDESISRLWVSPGLVHGVGEGGVCPETELETSSLDSQAEHPDRSKDNR